MREISFTITDEEGLHARPACQMMMAVRELSCDVRLLSRDREADVKNLMALMSLGVRKGETITFRFSGDQEEAAKERIERFLADWT